MIHFSYSFIFINLRKDCLNQHFHRFNQYKGAEYCFGLKSKYLELENSGIFINLHSNLELANKF
jgi:hypothetical protein